MEFKTDVLLHGGDYNPDQWLDRPDILEKDVEMLAESGCNVEPWYFRLVYPGTGRGRVPSGLDGRGD